MKSKTLPFCLSLLLCVVATNLWAEEASTEEATEIPTEVSEAPYTVGELCSKQGYYIERGEEETQINFRIVDNKMRVYWIDVNGLIAEPEAKIGNIRFTGNVRGRAYYGLTAISGDAGIGSPAVLPAPHIFNIILTLENAGKTTTHNFRYTADMDVSSTPEGATVPDEPEPKKSYY